MHAERTARILYSASDVTEEVLTDAELVFDGWYADADRIDWDDFIDRMTGHGRYDIEDMASPAVAKIQRHVRKLRNG